MRLDYPTFAGGELGPTLQSRYDTAKGKTGLRRARNVLLATAGGFYNRPGFRFGAQVYDNAALTRLIPFQFSLTQAYALELGDGYMRVISEGGLVLEPEVIVTAITKANPAVATVPDHGFAVGDDAYFVNITGMTQINNVLMRVTAVSGDDITLDIDSTAFGTFTGSGGGVAGNAEGGVGGQPPVPDIDDATPPFEGEVEWPEIVLPEYGWMG